MADEMNTIPPRLNELEREVHTAKYRLEELKDVHLRLSKVESSVDRLPQMEKQLAEQGEMMKQNFTIVKGMILGAGAVWVVFQAGPELLRFLGAR